MTKTLIAAGLLLALPVANAAGGSILAMTVQPASFLATSSPVQVNITASGDACYFRLRIEGKDTVFGGTVNSKGANSGFQRAFEPIILAFAGPGSYQLVAEGIPSPQQVGQVPQCGGVAKASYTVLPKLQFPPQAKLQSIQTASAHIEGQPMPALVTYESTACTFSLKLRPAAGGAEKSVGWYYNDGTTMPFQNLAAVFGPIGVGKWVLRAETNASIVKNAQGQPMPNCGNFVETQFSVVVPIVVKPPVNLIK
jgi:hypothetical protein